MSLLDAVNNDDIKLVRMYLEQIQQYKEHPETFSDYDYIPEINERNSNGETCLHIAAIYGYEEIMQLLLEADASVNRRDKRKRSPIFYVVGSYRKPISQIKKLIEFGADIHLPDSHGDTVLHLAVDNKQLDVVDLLLENKANVNNRNLDSNTPLHYAISSDNVELSKKLVVEYGADCYLENNSGLTPLHNIKSVEMLNALRDKCDAYLSKNGETLDFHFIAKGMTELCTERCLGIVNNQGETLLHRAMSTGSLKTIKYLIDRDICKMPETATAIYTLPQLTHINSTCSVRSAELQEFKDILSIYPHKIDIHRILNKGQLVYLKEVVGTPSSVARD